IAEPFGRDESDAGETALQHRIGRDRGAVDEVGDGVAVDIALAHQSLDGEEKRAARIVGTREDLDAGDLAVALVPGDAVGKGAADIDADPPAAARRARRHGAAAFRRRRPVATRSISKLPRFTAIPYSEAARATEILPSRRSFWTRTGSRSKGSP